MPLPKRYQTGTPPQPPPTTEVIGSTYQPFIDWCCGKLRIRQRPRIHWHDQPFTQFGQPSFAMYDIDLNEIWICKGGRHPLDVMRSLGHELTHTMQRERGELTLADGLTGTKVENDANTLAGILMREWGRKNPRVYESVNEASAADSMVKAILQRFRGGRPAERTFISMNTTGKRGAGEREVLKGLMGMFRDELTDIFKKLGLDKGWEAPLTYR